MSTTSHPKSDHSPSFVLKHKDQHFHSEKFHPADTMKQTQTEVHLLFRVFPERACRIEHICCLKAEHVFDHNPDPFQSFTRPQHRAERHPAFFSAFPAHRFVLQRVEDALSRRQLNCVAVLSLSRKTRRDDVGIDNFILQIISFCLPLIRCSLNTFSFNCA